MRKLIQFNTLHHLVVTVSGTSQWITENQSLGNTVASVAWNGGTEPVSFPGGCYDSCDCIQCGIGCRRCRRRSASLDDLSPTLLDYLDEIPLQIIDLFPESLIVASIQGWTRRIGINGRVYASSWEGLGVLPRIDVAICSRQDAYSKEDIVHWSNLARVLIVTNGSHGVTVYSGESVFELESLNVTEIDPTGAGDVFSAAFAVRFFETGNLLESSDFASVSYTHLTLPTILLV